MEVEQIKVDRFKKLLEYRDDPVLFLKEQGKITHPDPRRGGLIPFQTFPAQEVCIGNFKKNRFNIILKSRQLGISTIVAGYSLWKLLFFPHQEIRVVATKKETSQIIIKMAMTMLENIDPWIQEFLEAEQMSRRKHTIELKNGSRMQAFGQAKGSNPDTGVGNALSLLVIDEAALIANIKEVWTSIYPTLSQGGDCIILSTPRGTENWFYEMYEKARKGDYEPGEEAFVPMRFMWWENLERIGPYNPEETELVDDPSVIGGKTNSWARKTFSQYSPKEIAQEYCCDFTMSGDTALEPEFIRFIEEKGVIPPIAKMEEDQGLWVWKFPDPNRKYVIAADVARGDGSDYSTAQIIDVDAFEQVAEYHGKVYTDVFAQMLCSWGMRWNSALLIPENNTFGHSVTQKIIDMQYPNLFYFDKKFKGLVYNDSDRVSATNDKNEPGWPTNTRTRDLILPNLLKLLREYCLTQTQGGLTIHSDRLLSEIKSWGWYGGRLDHSKKSHDDLIMAMAIGGFVKAVYSRIGEASARTSEEMLKFFSNEKNYADMSFLPSRSTRGRVQNLEHMGQDISWLLK